MKIYGFRTQAYVGEQFVIKDQFLVIQFMPFLGGCRLTQVLQFVVFSGKKSCSRQFLNEVRHIEHVRHA